MRLACVTIAAAALLAQQPRQFTVTRVESSYAVAPGGLTGFFAGNQEADLTLSADGFNPTGGGLLFHHPALWPATVCAFFWPTATITASWYGTPYPPRIAGKETIAVWNQLPRAGELPDTVLERQVGSVRLGEIRGVAFDGERLYVADRQADRVYVWASPDHPTNPSPCWTFLSRGGSPLRAQIF